MFAKEIYEKRRAALREKVGNGLILLPGNTNSPNNYPNNAYYFRQDSTFLYYFGLNVPTLAGVIDAESGEEELYGDDFTVDDIIWTGPQPALADLGARAGITRTFPMEALKARVADALKKGRTVHYLPPYRGETKIELSELLGLPVSELHGHKSADLMFAVAEMREVKGPEEIEALERAFQIGYIMHVTAMKMCRPGVVEREISTTSTATAYSKRAACCWSTPAARASRATARTTPAHTPSAAASQTASVKYTRSYSRLTTSCRRSSSPA